MTNNTMHSKSVITHHSDIERAALISLLGLAPEVHTRDERYAMTTGEFRREAHKFVGADLTEAVLTEARKMPLHVGKCRSKCCTQCTTWQDRFYR